MAVKSIYTPLPELIELAKSIRIVSVRKPSYLTNFLKTKQPIAYAVVFPKILDEEWIRWEPETVWLTLDRIYGIELDEYEKSKVNAIKVMAFDRFKTEFETFEKVALAADGIPPRFDIMQDISPKQIANTLILSYIINMDFFEFSYEVKNYCAARLVESEYLILPDIMKIFQEEVKKLSGRAPMIDSIISRREDIPITETSEGVQVLKFKSLESDINSIKNSISSVMEDIYRHVR